jgi:hypothetical protein
MLLPTVEIGSPAVEPSPGKPVEARQTRNVRLEVPRGDEQGAVKSRSDRSDELFTDVRDGDVGPGKRVDARVRDP